MKWLDRLVLFGVSLIATPLLLFLGLWSVGAGEGNYVFAVLLFPFPIIANFLIAPFFSCPEFGDCVPRDAIIIAVAVIQFPLYGLLTSFSPKKVWMFAGIAFFHLCFFTCFWIYVGTVGFW